jgi:signal transduction histidine kinase
VEEIDLHNVISSLLDLYAANPNVEVTWNPVLVDAIMCVDKTQMNRLFTNLLTNAVDACSERENCLVVITEKLIDNDLLISVADNGDGIPKEMQSKIFTPNFTTKTSGTGLGLAMCKGIVEQAGGHIWFQTKEGQGTTFFVQLPLSRQ